MGSVPDWGESAAGRVPGGGDRALEQHWLCVSGGRVHVFRFPVLGSPVAAGRPLKPFLGYKYRPEKPGQEV